MSIKLHFLSSHIDYFPGKLGKYSEEYGEKSGMKDTKKRYKET